MRAQRIEFGSIALACLPTVTMACGAVLALARSESSWERDQRLWPAMGAAAVAPLIAVIVLRTVAPGYDLILVATAGMLTAIGAVMMFMLAGDSGPDAEFYLSIALRHGAFIALGFTALVAGALGGRYVGALIRFPLSLLGGAVALTALTAILGSTVNGAKLWLQLGPLRVQPSEIARLLLATFVAVYLYERRHLVSASWRVWSVDLPPAPYLFPLVAAVAAAIGVLIVQNDLGMAGLIAFGALTTIAASLDSRMSVAVATSVAAAGCAVSYFAVPRVRDRVSGWLDPWTDPAGRGFQFVQAEYSVAAGGVAGSAAERSVVSVPEVHTDLILVAVGGQLGWLGAIAVLLLASVLVGRCMHAALRSSGGVASYVALAIGVLLGVQLLLIVGGTLRVLPLTGLTFPLVSYGGTSMITTLFSLGLVVGIGAFAQQERP